jgi:trehalose 6-phosphate synthase/phosphatase
VPPLSPERMAATTIVAIGDDRTDEDLFGAMPPEAITIKVGPGETKARFRVDGVTAVRQILQSLVDAGVGAGAERA